MAVFGGATIGRCWATLVSSASERVRLLPRRDVGRRMLVATVLSGFAKGGGVSCKEHTHFTNVFFTQRLKLASRMTEWQDSWTPHGPLQGGSRHLALRAGSASCPALPNTSTRMLGAVVL